jgi:hypothetical protein
VNYLIKKSIIIKKKGEIKMQAIMEGIFEFAYLIGSIVLGIFIIIINTKKNKKPAYYIFAVAVFILTIGDAFHLVPRVLNLSFGGGYEYMMTVGTIVTSVTISVYYLFLYYFIQIDLQKRMPQTLNWVVLVLTIVRIVILFIPQNQWFDGGNYTMGIVRNIPFVIVGAIVIFMFFKYYFQDKNINKFKFAWLYIILSFVFYLIVVFGVEFGPLFGLIMLPKTVFYVLITVLGLLAIRKQPLEEQTNSEVSNSKNSSK